ncbi:MAG: ArsA-related P-loop ATPase, partial [Polyangiales bacterium]
MGLAEVLGSHRVVVTVGSGGVGKTTTAAAMAVYAAMKGRKVLCLTIDPARRLANSLGLDEMTTSEQDVPRSLFQSHGLQCTGALSAMMLDTKRTFDGLVTKYASDEEARDRILNNQIYQYVASSLAGTQEYMAMEKLHEVRQDPK